MATTKITKIIIEKDGEEKAAYPVSKEEIEKASKELGEDLFRCRCGEERCIGGYVWRCAYGPSGNCQWFSSDWRCNG